MPPRINQQVCLLPPIASASTLAEVNSGKFLQRGLKGGPKGHKNGSLYTYRELNNQEMNNSNTNSTTQILQIHYDVLKIYLKIY